MLTHSNSVCLLASVAVWYVRKRKHCKALHRTAQQRAQHGTARRARHLTALRRAVELAKLNGAGDTVVCFLCFQLYAAGCDTKKELEPAPTESD